MLKSHRLLSYFVAAIVMCAPAAAFAAGVRADIQASLIGTYSGTNPLGSVVFSFNEQLRHQLSPGTTLGKADALFSDTRTLAASASQDLDLAGVLTDPFGQVLTFAKVKAVYIKAAAGNTNSLVVGGAGSNAFVGPFGDASDKITIPPGGSVLLIHPGAGWTVTPATGDLLQVTNSAAGTAVSYDVVLIGATS